MKHGDVTYIRTYSYTERDYNGCIIEAVSCLIFSIKNILPKWVLGEK